MRRLPGLSSTLRRASARLLLLTLSVTTLGPVLHGVHDPDCDPALAFHDEREHHYWFSAPDAPDSASSDHCVACHFVRTSRSPVSWQPVGPHGLSSGARLFQPEGQLPAALHATPQPARAPPLV
jgi:hypothetical protein